MGPTLLGSLSGKGVFNVHNHGAIGSCSWSSEIFYWEGLGGGGTPFGLIDREVGVQCTYWFLIKCTV